MGLIALRCPHCSGDIQFDMDRNFGFCNYCGTKLIRDDIVASNISISNDIEIKSCIELGKESLLLGDFNKCEYYVEKARSLDNKIADEYYLLAACNKLSSEEYLKYINQASDLRDLNIFGLNDCNSFQVTRIIFSIPKHKNIFKPSKTTIKIDGFELTTIFGADVEKQISVVPGYHEMIVEAQCQGSNGISMHTMHEKFNTNNVNSFSMHCTTWDFSVYLKKEFKNNCKNLTSAKLNSQELTQTNSNAFIKIKLPESTLGAEGNFFRFVLEDNNGVRIDSGECNEIINIKNPSSLLKLKLKQINKKGLRKIELSQDLLLEVEEGKQYNIVLIEGIFTILKE